MPAKPKLRAAVGTIAAILKNKMMWVGVAALVIGIAIGGSWSAPAPHMPDLMTKLPAPSAHKKVPPKHRVPRKTAPGLFSFN
jgi:hypothetical protein